MNIVATIIPIFAVIFLGWLAREKGFMPPEFLGPANRLVYYLAIPAMIFRAISKASLKTEFNIMVIIITLLSILTVFVFVWGIASIKNIKQKYRGTFIQSSFHGNLGYIGFAVSYYFLGSEGFVRASIIGGFVMLLQNTLAVVALQFYSNRVYSNSASAKENRLKILVKILNNPVILSAIAGILFSVAEIPIPLVADRILKIISDFALPVALLIIGASLSFGLMRLPVSLVLLTGFVKLVLLPCLGFFLYRISGITLHDFLPGLILLASPTATVTYVMAKEMKGDADFAVAAISTSTILSAITFSVWLNIAG